MKHRLHLTLVLLLFVQGLALLHGCSNSESEVPGPGATGSTAAQVLNLTPDNTLLRVIGGIFVVVVGVYIFAQDPVPQIRRNRAGRSSLWQDFASIFGITIANFILVIPYILACFAAFKVSSSDVGGNDVAGISRAIFVIFGFFCGACAWWTLLACVINLFRRRFRPRHMLTINHVAGLIIGLLGIYTILSTFFDIFPNVGH